MYVPWFFVAMDVYIKVLLIVYKKLRKNQTANHILAAHVKNVFWIEMNTKLYWQNCTQNILANTEQNWPIWTEIGLVSITKERKKTVMHLIFVVQNVMKNKMKTDHNYSCIGQWFIIISDQFRPIMNDNQ